MCFSVGAVRSDVLGLLSKSLKACPMTPASENATTNLRRLIVNWLDNLPDDEQLVFDHVVTSVLIDIAAAALLAAQGVQQRSAVRDG